MKLQKLLRVHAGIERSYGRDVRAKMGKAIESGQPSSMVEQLVLGPRSLFRGWWRTR